MNLLNIFIHFNIYILKDMCDDGHEFIYYEEDSDSGKRI